MNLSLALLATFSAAADAITFSYPEAQELVESYFNNPDDRADIRNVEASGHSCFALFANGHNAGRNSLTNQFLLPNDGIILSTGKPADFHTNDSDETTTDFGITTGDAHLEHYLFAQGSEVLDPCFIQFEFSCPESTDIYTPQVSFDYVFGSDEYFQKKKKEEEVVDPEAINRGPHPDLLGFFLNGQNIALVPDENGGMTDVSINHVNEKRNTQNFVGNKYVDATSLYSGVEADGFTTKMTALGDAKPGWNIIKLAIGDAVDGNLDSWVLLEAGSFTCALGAPKNFQPPTTQIEVVTSAAEENKQVEGTAGASKKGLGAGVFFILLVAIVVVAWVLVASGAIKVNRKEKGRNKVAFDKPDANQIKPKSIEMFGEIKAKSIETFGTIKAKTNEKFGSKKVNPDESATAQSKDAQQEAEQPEETESEV